MTDLLVDVVSSLWEEACEPRIVVPMSVEIDLVAWIVSYVMWMVVKDLILV